MMKRAAIATSISAFALAATALPAMAAPKTVATYKDWVVFSQDLGGDTVCYAVTEPTDKSPRSVNHGDVFFLVASWKSGVAKNQPNFVAGYTLRNAPEPVVRVGADKWDMYVSDQEGFIEKDADEQRLVSAMKRGANMRLTAVSERGTATNYTFSLLGVSAALERAAKECR